jgi:hypothetical protein
MYYLKDNSKTRQINSAAFLTSSRYTSVIVYAYL